MAISGTASSSTRVRRRQMKTTIGILGLGPMGGIIATNLLVRGF
jgi:hypothetical protein